jgi:hypothetical protein
MLVSISLSLSTYVFLLFFFHPRAAKFLGIRTRILKNVILIFNHEVLISKEAAFFSLSSK